MVTNPIELGPVKKGTSRTVKTIFVIGVIAIVAIGILLHTGSSLTEDLLKTIRSLGTTHGQHVTCVVYERSPRTGSSTIGQSLSSCLQTKGYDVGKGPWMQYHKVLPFMLSLPSTKKAIVTRHFVLPYRELREVLGRCEHLFWISSTRGMRERLLSKAKFDARGRHGSSKMGRAEERLVLENLSGRDVVEAEEVYERYPYVGDGKTLRVTPDYVIRAEYLEQDLGELLKALGCEKMVVRNVHSLNSSVDGGSLRERVELRMGDRRHKLMTFLAGEVNERGLEAARWF